MGILVIVGVILFYVICLSLPTIMVGVIELIKRHYKELFVLAGIAMIIGLATNTRGCQYEEKKKPKRSLYQRTLS